MGFQYRYFKKGQKSLINVTQTHDTLKIKLEKAEDVIKARQKLSCWTEGQNDFLQLHAWWLEHVVASSVLWQASFAVMWWSYTYAVSARLFLLAFLSNDSTSWQDQHHRSPLWLRLHPQRFPQWPPQVYLESDLALHCLAPAALLWNQLFVLTIPLLVHSACHQNQTHTGNFCSKQEVARSFLSSAAVTSGCPWATMCGNISQGGSVGTVLLMW